MAGEISTPDWVKEAVFYQIFPDRFASSPLIVKPSNLEPWDSPPTRFGFKGGDLLGISENLDYLQDLGVNAIYFNPIFQSASNHRYHTHDYYRVDPLLGGDQAFRTLLEESRRRGLRIVLDGVFNHASRGFFQFNHLLECGPASPYIDWFTIKGFPLNAYQGEPGYRCWDDLPALPAFNTGNALVCDFIFGVARYWLEQGIDGWRLDVPFEIDDDLFWQQFRRVVKEVNLEAYIVGEIATEAQRWLQGDQFDAVMNYQFTQACLGFFAGQSLDRELERGMMGMPPTQVLDAPAFARRAEELLNLYPPQIVAAQLNLIGSHDMPRFLSLASRDKSAFRLATLFQMTYPGAPCIYYGDETGMLGGRDPDNRAAFSWDTSRWDTDLWEYVKKCIAMRNKHPALRRGDFMKLFAEGQVYAYLRRLPDSQYVIALNAGQANYPLQIPALGFLPELAVLKDLLARGEAVVKDGYLSGLVVPPRSGMVLHQPIEKVL